MFYFEIKYPEGTKYFYHGKDWSRGQRDLWQRAHRVWHEKEHEIVWAKNRLSDSQTTPVNMEEFFLVKLSAVEFTFR